MVVVTRWPCWHVARDGKYYSETLWPHSIDEERQSTTKEPRTNQCEPGAPDILHCVTWPQQPQVSPTLDGLGSHPYTIGHTPEETHFWWNIQVKLGEMEARTAELMMRKEKWRNKPINRQQPWAKRGSVTLKNVLHWVWQILALSTAKCRAEQFLWSPRRPQLMAILLCRQSPSPVLGLEHMDCRCPSCALFNTLHPDHSQTMASRTDWVTLPPLLWVTLFIIFQIFCATSNQDRKNKQSLTHWQNADFVYSINNTKSQWTQMALHE